MVVFIPPKIHAKANGIRNLEGCQSIFWQTFSVIGKSMANAPMLFINDDKNAAIKSKKIKNCNSENFLVPINLPTSPVRPEFFNPWLITNTNATVKTAGWENPKNASDAGITPTAIKIIRAPIVRASYLNLLHINDIRRPARVRESINWSLIECFYWGTLSTYNEVDG